MSRGLFLLFICLLCASLCRSQELSEVAFSGDSTYRRVIQGGQDSLNCYLSYPLGKHEVLRGFGNNDRELTRLSEFIHRAFSDTLIYVRSVRLTGYSSIDGTYAVNETLARNRVESMRRYLDREYGLSSRYPLRTDYVSEDWGGLRQLLLSSDYAWRGAALQIIDQTDVFNGRESQLMLLNGGEPYREMLNRLFPLLRRVEILVEYDLRKIIEQRFKRKLSDMEFQSVLAREREKAAAEDARLNALRQRMESGRLDAAAAREQARQQEARRNEMLRQEQERMAARQKMQEAERERIRQERLRFKPVFAIKTNLVSWAGVTPEFERATFMPNLSGEVFFAKRFSAEVSAVYSDFDFGSGEHWGVTGYGLEPRFWLKGNSSYKGFFLGVYGRAGDFNVLRTDGNYTGTYMQAGVSLGYYLLLTKRWGVELGVRGGYHKSDAGKYVVNGEHLYLLDEKVDGNRVGLTGLNVSVAYRF